MLESEILKKIEKFYIHHYCSTYILTKQGRVNYFVEENDNIIFLLPSSHFFVCGLGNQDTQLQFEVGYLSKKEQLQDMALVIGQNIILI